MSQAASRRIEVSPAALGSVGLHIAVAAAFMISWGARDLKVGAVVPVTIVSSAPDLDARPAEQAPETVAAATEIPAPEAPAEPTPPQPTPAPPPPPPPKAKAAPTPTPKAPAPARPAPKPAPSSLDLDSLYDSLQAPARNAAQRPSSAPRGPTRRETAPVARQTTGTGLAAGDAVTGMTEELQRRWNPNCTVEGGRDVQLKVFFQLGVTGQVVGDVTSQLTSAGGPVATAAAERAVRAVYAAAPFRGLPREYYGQRFSVTFNAREACAR
ncbi:MAG: energy transducer TonB [Phenylobacterium sp.]|nr:energy transducer TonB [Phenylobacterium sp.]